MLAQAPFTPPAAGSWIRAELSADRGWLTSRWHLFAGDMRFDKYGLTLETACGYETWPVTPGHWHLRVAGDPNARCKRCELAAKRDSLG